MADDFDDDAPATPPDLLPALQAKADLAARKVDLLERRIAAWESELAELRALVRAVPTPESVSGPQDRLDDLEARVARMEKRSLRALASQAAQRVSTEGSSVHFAGPDRDVPADARALVFSSWTPIEAAAGETVTLSVTVDGFEVGDEVLFSVTDLAGEPLDRLTAKVGRHDTDKVSVGWAPPPPAKGGHREFRFTASCRGREDRSPVLTVRA